MVSQTQATIVANPGLASRHHDLSEVRELLRDRLSREFPHGLDELGERLQQELACIDREVLRRLAALDWLQARRLPVQRPPVARWRLWRRKSCQVEHLFVIQAGSGLLLDHASAPGVKNVDADAVAGMLTAIEHFVCDSMEVTGGGALGAATVGEYRLRISHGPWARVAVFVRGTTPRSLGKRLDRLNHELHELHGDGLADTNVSTDRGRYLLPNALSKVGGHREMTGEPHSGKRWITALGSAAARGFAWSSPALYRTSGEISALAAPFEAGTVEYPWRNDS